MTAVSHGLLMAMTRAIHDIDCSPTCGEDLTTYGRYGRYAAAAIAAMLGQSEVRESWGHRDHGTDGTPHDAWDPNRKTAERVVAALLPPMRRTLIRRLHITTPTEELPAGAS